MAPKEETTEIDEEQLRTDEQDEGPRFSEFSEFFREGDSTDYTIDLYRLKKGFGKKPETAWIETYYGELPELRDIRALYGPGSYKFIGKRKGVFKSSTINIDGPAVKEQEPERKDLDEDSFIERMAKYKALFGSTGNDSSQVITEMLKTQNEQNRQFMAALRESDQRMITLLTSSPKGEKSNINELLAGLRALDELRGDGATPAAGGGGIMEFLQSPAAKPFIEKFLSEGTLTTTPTRRPPIESFTPEFKAKITPENKETVIKALVDTNPGKITEIEARAAVDAVLASRT